MSVFDGSMWSDNVWDASLWTSGAWDVETVDSIFAGLDPGLGAFYYDPARSDRIFADTAGTVPALPLDPVAFMWDNARDTPADMAQATAASQPRRAGRQRPIWVPTWATDLRLAQQAVSWDTTLIIEDVGYRLWYADQPGRRDIAIHAPDGTRILRRITAVDQVVAGEERITIDVSPGQILPAGTRISYLALMRLDADQIELAWHTASVAICSANLRLIAD